MKLLSITVAVLSVASPLASAWRIQLFDNGEVIHDRRGTVSQPCENLGSNSNKAQSFRWETGTPNCRIRIYDSEYCSGSPLGDSGWSNWNGFFSKKILSSYKIDCWGCAAHMKCNVAVPSHWTEGKKGYLGGGSELIWSQKGFFVYFSRSYILGFEWNYLLFETWLRGGVRFPVIGSTRSSWEQYPLQYAQSLELAVSHE